MFRKLKAIYATLSFAAFLALIKVSAPTVMMFIAGSGWI